MSKKDSILAAARVLFSKNGYDATSVDEIALQAGVTKSLIYYHFKSKEALLNRMISDFMNEYKRLLQDDSERGVDKITQYLDFLRKNRDCVCVILTESLRQGENNTLFFKSLDTLTECTEESEKNNRLHWVTEFFTSIVPSVLYVCYEESWCNYFGDSKEELHQNFIQAYRLTHGLYHDHTGKESL